MQKSETLKKITSLQHTAVGNQRSMQEIDGQPEWKSFARYFVISKQVVLLRESINKKITKSAAFYWRKRNIFENTVLLCINSYQFSFKLSLVKLSTYFNRKMTRKLLWVDFQRCDSTFHQRDLKLCVSAVFFCDNNRVNFTDIQLEKSGRSL